MGKGNPIKEILKAPSKIIGEVTGQSDLLKAQKKQEEAQKKQLEKEEAEAKALEAKQKSDEESINITILECKLLLISLAFIKSCIY